MTAPAITSRTSSAFIERLESLVARSAVLALAGNVPAHDATTGMVVAACWLRENNYVEALRALHKASLLFSAHPTPIPYPYGTPTP